MIDIWEQECLILELSPPATPLAIFFPNFLQQNDHSPFQEIHFCNVFPGMESDHFVAKEFGKNMAMVIAERKKEARALWKPSPMGSCDEDRALKRLMSNIESSGCVFSIMVINSKYGIGNC